MRKTKSFGLILAGAVAGTVNGLFGAGGGMVLVPLLMILTSIEPESVFPSSISIILPICLISLSVTAMKGSLPWAQAIPYLMGSAIGGVLSGLWGKKIPAKWLHRGLGVLIIWGGVRYLC